MDTVGTDQIKDNSVTSAKIQGVAASKVAYASTNVDAQLTTLGNALGNASGFQQAGTGAVTRPFQDKARERVSILDFYVDGDPDYTLAFQRANSYLSGGSGGIIDILDLPDIYVDYISLSPGVGIKGRATRVGNFFRYTPIHQNLTYTAGALLQFKGVGTTSVARHGSLEKVCLCRVNADNSPDQTSGSSIFAIEFAQMFSARDVACFGGDAQLTLKQVWDSTFVNVQCMNGGTSVSLQGGGSDSTNNLRVFDLHCEQFTKRALESIGTSGQLKNNKIIIVGFKAESLVMAGHENIYLENTEDFLVYGGHASLDAAGVTPTTDHAMIRFGNGAVNCRFNDYRLADNGIAGVRDCFVAFEATNTNCGGSFAIQSASSPAPTSGIFHVIGATTSPRIACTSLYQTNSIAVATYSVIPTNPVLVDDKGRQNGAFSLYGGGAAGDPVLSLSRSDTSNAWTIKEISTGAVQVTLNGSPFYTLTTDGRIALYGLGSNPGNVNSTPTNLTSANFSSASDEVNTKGKFSGRQCWDGTSLKPVFAKGSTTASAWIYADGTTAYTPA